MVGQKNLLNKIDAYTLSTLPHSIILLGEEGCGKHTLAHYMSDKFFIEFHDITNSLTLETIESISIATSVGLYVIDTSNITVKEENVILKFLEEPPSCAYIILLCGNKNKLLPTILNRCQIFEFEAYTKEELKEIVPNVAEDLLGVLTTPGDLQKLSGYSATAMVSYINKIFDCIGKASYANVLKLTRDLIYTTAEKEKVTDNKMLRYDFTVFVKMLVNVLLNRIKSEDRAEWYTAYRLTNNLISDSKILHVDKRMLYERYLLNLNLLMGGKNYDHTRFERSY